MEKELKFTNVLTRKFSFGKASITYTDDGVNRKAQLYFGAVRLFNWESGDNDKWIASALCHFAKEMRNQQNFPIEMNYQIGCLIGYSMAERNIGRYWHEYNNPNEISAALTTCQARTGRVFIVPGNKLKEFNPAVIKNKKQQGGLHSVH